MIDSLSDSKILWQPGAEQIAGANITRFQALVTERYGIAFHDYNSLWRWSIENRELFWPLLWEFSNVLATKTSERALTDGNSMPGAQWFSGSRLNYAENLLRRDDESSAIIFHSESGERREFTWRSLRALVSVFEQHFLAIGLKPEDRVAALLPNIPEAVAAMLACASIGAIWSSTSPDFGESGVLDRFLQIEPKIFLCADGYHYNGKWIETVSRAQGVAQHLTSLQSVVLIPYGQANNPGTISGTFSFCRLADLTRDYVPRALSFNQLPFDHPLFILYSSGTTGVPKCIVHGAGGTLLQHLKELGLHTDIKSGERVFYFTTCGWMMWNWLVSSLALGATVCLFDGAPLYPEPSNLFRIAQQEGFNVFGTSAKFLLAVEKAGVDLRSDENMSVALPTVRAILSTGSPLPPSSYKYVYERIKSDVCLSSISGGTDIVSCFALGNPTLPVRAGELQCRGLGMSVEVWDETGRSLIGEKGELVCTKPFPSMPIYFWNDPTGEKYRESYFTVFPGIWRHGDWCELTTSGGLVIFGRSDAVLNPGGVRIGTAEIYRQVEQLTEIAESLVIGQRWQDDERIILFVKLQPGCEPNSELFDKIRTVIRAQLTPRHVPAKIVAVKDIPKTISGKIVELAVRKVVHGEPVKNSAALANPEALEYFRNLPELQE